VRDAPAVAGGVVVMGFVVAPFGVHGWIKVRPSTEEPAGLLRYPAWHVQSDRADAWAEMKVVAGHVHGGMLVAQLAGIASREAALALKGRQIGVARAVMPAAPPGEIYWADLVGMTVVNRSGVTLGTVAAVTEHGAHPLLRLARTLEAGGTERLVPYVPAIVDRVDVAGRRIEVDWGEDY
jgi:16S rRNA processing protein RimM